MRVLAFLPLALRALYLRLHVAVAFARAALLLALFLIVVPVPGPVLLAGCAAVAGRPVEATPEATAVGVGEGVAEGLTGRGAEHAGPVGLLLRGDDERVASGVPAGTVIWTLKPLSVPEGEAVASAVLLLLALICLTLAAPARGRRRA